MSRDIASKAIADFFNPQHECDKDSAVQCGKHSFSSAPQVLDLMSTITCSAKKCIR